MFITILFALAGLIAGVVAVRKNDARRNMAIAGVIVNLLCVLPYLAMLLLSLAAGGMDGK